MLFLNTGGSRGDRLLFRGEFNGNKAGSREREKKRKSMG